MGGIINLVLTGSNIPCFFCLEHTITDSYKFNAIARDVPSHSHSSMSFVAIMSKPIMSKIM